MLTELRRYSVRPGHMPAMHRRMQDLLLPMFPDHGIPVPMAIWENSPDPATLTWLLGWPSFEARQAAWQSIAPAFAAARQQQGGEEFVTRTTLTLLSPWPGHELTLGDFAAGPCETAWHVQPRIGKAAQFMSGAAALCDRFAAAGARQVTTFNLMFGALPQAMILIGWDSSGTRAGGMAQLATLPSGALADLLVGGGELLLDYGEWEELNRAPYLSGWIAP